MMGPKKAWSSSCSSGKAGGLSTGEVRRRMPVQSPLFDDPSKRCAWFLKGTSCLPVRKAAELVFCYPVVSEFVFVQPASMVDFPADLPSLVWLRCYRHAGPGISTCTKNVHWPRPEAVATQLSPLRWSRT